MAGFQGSHRSTVTGELQAGFRPLNFSPAQRGIDLQDLLEQRGCLLSPISELSVRITSPIIGPCMSGPSRMISFPAVESPKYHTVTDYPCASIPIHILVTIQTYVFIPIPGIIRRGVGSDRHWGWRLHHHYWWRNGFNGNGQPIWAWPHRHKTTRKQPSHSHQTRVIYLHLQRTFV